MEKPFSAAGLLAKAGEVLSDDSRGFANAQENPMLTRSAGAGR